MGRRSSWNKLVDKFQEKLSAWKAKSLSFGGRKILCKPVLGSLGVYLFSLFKVPENVLNTLESLRNQFIWGWTGQSRKIIWVRWNVTCNSMVKGGIGIGSLKTLNWSLLAKWWSRFLNEEGSLWRDCIKAFHGARGGIFSDGCKKPGVWGAITKWDILIRKVGLNVNNFWSVDINGIRRWTLSEDGVFSVKTCRGKIEEGVLQSDGRVTKWNKLVPGKVNMPIWRLSKSRLPTRYNLSLRGVRVSSVLCPCCLSQPETEGHLLFGCSTTKVIGAYVKNWWSGFPCQATNLAEFFSAAQFPFKGKKVKEVLEVILMAFIWMLWTNQNVLVFNKPVKNPLVIYKEIVLFLFNWIRLRSKSCNSLDWNVWCISPLTTLL
ncbi:uncharacterized protein LOC112521803 [Cynara cardunculus var. scolymus]|uniref:uncharacterized protein LOC112521803 n=1 Tax=Cynara cardunculus var. scolymus TaxID=59895 RepID=UPI000D630E1D|nr:uncharacterized protein LOC112521803 [Cynara cardunculus var. scolymus]